MGKSKSEPSAQEAGQGVSNTEYTVKSGKQGVFTHSRLSACEHYVDSNTVKDHSNGVEKEYAIYERVVTYPELDVWPVADKDGTVAEKLQGQSSKVTERKVS